MDADGKWVVVSRQASGDRFLQGDGTWSAEAARAALYGSLGEALAASDWSHHVLPAPVARSLARGAGLTV
ncbi:MAG TPA: hypothetical protein VM286_07785 [Candidatus Thermoplasmatota archaeon]|nr:hypothetical protein [Candidatus Thermoplasmatota archaeon]